MDIPPAIGRVADRAIQSPPGAPRDIEEPDSRHEPVVSDHSAFKDELDRTGVSRGALFRLSGGFFPETPARSEPTSMPGPPPDIVPGANPRATATEAGEPGPMEQMARRPSNLHVMATGPSPEMPAKAMASASKPYPAMLADSAEPEFPSRSVEPHDPRSPLPGNVASPGFFPVTARSASGLGGATEPRAYLPEADRHVRDGHAEPTPAGRGSGSKLPLAAGVSIPDPGAGWLAAGWGREKAAARAETSDMLADAIFALHDGTVEEGGRRHSAILPGERVNGSTPPPPGPAPASQIAARILARGGEAAGPIEIALDPPELGRVRIVIHPAELAVALSIHAELPQTLELLRRQSDSLLGELRSMGYDSVDLEFSSQHDREDGTPDVDWQMHLQGGPEQLSENAQAHVPGSMSTMAAAGRLDLRT